MKKIWNSFKIAFSMYSKIPMPQSEWTDENMSLAMCFFPWVGAVIGLVTWFVYQAGQWVLLRQNQGQNPGLETFALGNPLFLTILLVLIPIFITGGIHLDGFLDTQDALSSYQSMERRLEILKDSHAGAFAIISCSVYFLAYIGIYSALTDRAVEVITISFMLSRTLSGLSVICFPQARKKGQGLVATFSESAEKRVNRRTLFAYLIILSVILILVGRLTGLAVVITALLMFWYYHHMCMSKFGGVTGDLAGYFLQMCEILMALAAVVAEQILLLVR